MGIESTKLSDSTTSDCDKAVVISSTFFKVKFIHDKNQQGASKWIETIRVFQAVTADELHKKIDEYLRERHNDFVDRWYYGKMVDVTRL